MTQHNGNHEYYELFFSVIKGQFLRLEVSMIIQISSYKKILRQTVLYRCGFEQKCTADIEKIGKKDD